MTIKGQDWAGYQSATPDLTGLDFAFTKVTEGLSYVNPRWVSQRDHAKKAGLVWGGYHYPHMSNDPKAEADYFLKQVTWKPGDLIVLDWEGYDKANAGVSNARKLVYRDAWLKYVKGKMPGYRVGMYCNLDYWKNLDTTSNCGDFLWIATGGLPAGNPGVSYDWTIHQYSTAGSIDHDVAKFASRAAMAAWAKGTSIPQEDPVTTTDDNVKALRDNLLVITSLTEKDAKGVAAKHGAGYFLAHIDAKLTAVQASEAAQNAAIAALAKLIGSGVDTDAVVAAVNDSIKTAVAAIVKDASVSVNIEAPQ